MGLLELLLLAVGLAMDAFAVSVCGGMRLAEDRKFRGGLQYGAWFGIFQALMPFRVLPKLVKVYPQGTEIVRVPGEYVPLRQRVL